MIKSVFFGSLGSLGLLFLYFLIMGLGSGSWDYTLRELLRLRYWVIPLIIGFGLQVGLYSYLKDCVKAGHAEKSAAFTGTAASTTAMLACCAHHLTDVLPLIGLSAATVFLVKYQLWFLGLGIISNLVGILIMVRSLRKMKV